MLGDCAISSSIPRIVLASAVFFLGSAATPRAEATVVKAMTLLEKTEASPVVVHGTVQRVEAFWELEGARVATRVSVKVLEAIKGDLAPGETIVVRRGGGRIGDFDQTAPGLEDYTPGEEVVLFLEPLGAELVALGIGIGTYRVESRAGAKEVTHAPDVAGLRFDGDKPIIEPISPMVPEPLELFLKRVRSYARAIPTAPNATPRKGVMLRPPLEKQLPTTRQ